MVSNYEMICCHSLGKMSMLNISESRFNCTLNTPLYHERSTNPMIPF